MDRYTDADLRRLERLCLRHRASLLFADLRDATPAMGEPSSPFSPQRPEVLERALSCERCRSRNELDAAARSSTGASGPIWNPSTANLGSDIPLSLPPAGYGFGDRRKRPGPELHLGWVIAGACGLAVAVGVTVVGVRDGSAPATSRETGSSATSREAGSSQVTDGTLVDYPDLKAGDCVEDMVSEENLDLLVVSCAEPHTDEVIATFTLPPGKWPGTRKVDQLSWRGCASQFERYVGVPPEDSSLELYNLSPLKMDWDYDQLVVCTVAEGFEPNTGSLKNADR